MYENTIEKRGTYINQDDIEIVDLGERIFKNDNIYAGISLSFARVSHSMDMRPDLVSEAAYNDDKYTDLIMAYNNIQNPFSIQRDDVLIIPSIMHIDENVASNSTESVKNQDELIRAFHKYVSASKKPDTQGSEENTSSIPKTRQDSPVSYTEANMAQKGKTAITEIDGRLYFGTDSGLQCATNGMTTSDYIKKVVQNTVYDAN